VAKKARSKKARPAKSKAGTKTAKTAAKRAEKPKAEKPKAEEPKKVKCPLTRTQLKQMRRALMAKRKAILGDMSGMEAEALGTARHGAAGDLSKMPTHPADIGTDNYEQEFTLGLLESERSLLMGIDEALARIDNGTYGICLGTGKPINKARLEARPWAKYCIEYARLLEKGLIHPGEEDQAG
jgi:RNA polymerase-binding protein DksA